VPFRESRITHLLQDCFLDDVSVGMGGGAGGSEEGERAGGGGAGRGGRGGGMHKLIIVATVSPAARDAIHTRNTLNHVCDLGMYMCIYVYICVYVCMYIHVCMYACT
jgi:hypothetical protein